MRVSRNRVDSRYRVPPDRSIQERAVKVQLASSLVIHTLVMAECDRGLRKVAKASGIDCLADATNRPSTDEKKVRMPEISLGKRLLMTSVLQPSR